MKKSIKIVIAVFMLISCFKGISQDFNQLDSKGERHGIWKKNFEGTNVLRYEGEFNHGKEKGTFKFYTNVKGKAVLTATKEFLPDGTAKTIFMSSKGKPISEGLMRGKDHIGEWKYYHKDNQNVMTIEHYNNVGELEGENITYFENGMIAEKRNYKAGKLNGKATWYTDKGTVTKIYHYKDGMLHGEAKFYGNSGSLVQEGQYKNDRKDGIWKFYENGELKEEKDFTRRSNNPYKKK